MVDENIDQNWLEKLKGAVSSELWDQIRDEIGKFTQEEIAVLVDRVRLGNLQAAYAAIYGKLGPGETLEAWDALNVRWQTINEEQWNRLQTARAVSMGILEAIAKLALVGVFL